MGTTGMKGRARAMLCGVALVGAAPERAALPPPSAMPLAADPAGDPLLGFVGRADDAAFGAAVAGAVTRSPDVAEAAAVVAETIGVRQEVRAALRPRLDLDLSAQQVIARDFDQDPDNVIERSRPDRRADAVATAEQLLFDFGAARERLRAARAREAAARAQVAVVAEEEAARAAAAWFELYAAQAEGELGAALVARHDSILSDTRERAAQGVGAAGDVPRVETYRAAARVRLERGRQSEAAARLRYREVFGEDAPARVGRPAPAGITATMADAQARARDGAAATVAGAQIVAARRDLGAARADRLPRFTAGVDAAKYSVFEDQIDHDVRARLTLRHRLYGGGASGGRVAQASARVQQSEFARDRIVEEAARDAGIAWRDVEALGRQEAILREGYVAGRRTRDLYVEQFRVARGSLIELLRAESDFHDAAVAYVRGVAQADAARYTLLARTGAILPALGVEIAQP